MTDGLIDSLNASFRLCLEYRYIIMYHHNYDDHHLGGGLVE